MTSHPSTTKASDKPLLYKALMLSLWIWPTLLLSTPSCAQNAEPNFAQRTSETADQQLASLSLAGNELQIFELPLQDLLQLTITTASRIDEQASESVSNTFVMDRNQIVATGATNLNDLLKFLPGVAIAYGRNGQSIIHLRGINSEWSGKLLYLLNGHRISEPMHGSATPMHLDVIPTAHIERIEFVRGASSALYGSDAFVGVVNIITRSGKSLGNQIENSGATAMRSDSSNIANDTSPNPNLNPNLANGSTQWRYAHTVENSQSVADNLNLLTGASQGELEVALNVNMVDQQGYALTMDQDIFGNSGEVQNGYRQSDVYRYSRINDLRISASSGLQKKPRSEAATVLRKSMIYNALLKI